MSARVYVFSMGITRCEQEEVRAKIANGVFRHFIFGVPLSLFNYFCSSSITMRIPLLVVSSCAQNSEAEWETFAGECLVI